MHIIFVPVTQLKRFKKISLHIGGLVPRLPSGYGYAYSFYSEPLSLAALAARERNPMSCAAAWCHVRIRRQSQFSVTVADSATIVASVDRA